MILLWTISLYDVLMMDHQMTEQTTTPLVVTTRLLVEDVELYLLLVSVYIVHLIVLQHLVHCTHTGTVSMASIVGIIKDYSC